MRVGATARAPGRHPLLALWALGILVRVPVALATRTEGLDEALLFNYGSSWLRTGTCSGIQWPAPYQLLVGGLGMLIGARPAIELIFVLVGSLVALPLFAAMRRLRSEEAAWWGAGSVALLPAVGAVVNKSGTHSLYLPLLGLAFLLHVLVLEAPTARRLALLGALLGLGYVVRTDGLVVLAVVAASMLVVRRWSVGGRLRAAGLVVAASLLFVVPNVAHIHRVTGRWSLSTSASALAAHPYWQVAEPDAETRAQGEEFMRAEGGLFEKLASHPGFMARRVLWNFRQFLRLLGDIHVFPAIFFAPLGLCVPAFARGWERGAFLLATWACPTLAFLALHVEARYFSPTAMILMLFTGEGWARAREALAERPRVFRLAVAVAGLFLLGLSAMTAWSSRLGDEPRVEERAAVVREQAGAELARTFVFNPHVRLVLDGRPGAERTLPDASRAAGRIFVVDPDAWWNDERQLFSEVAKQGGRFRDWRAGGLEFHQRLD